MKVGDVVKARDGQRYEILAVENLNHDEPQMSRYEVKRVSDGATISNYPGYLLIAPKEAA